MMGPQTAVDEFEQCVHDFVGPLLNGEVHGLYLDDAFL